MSDSPTTMSHEAFGQNAFGSVDALADLCAESIIVFGLDLYRGIACPRPFTQSTHDRWRL